MEIYPEQIEIFRSGSKTYFNSSLFFPERVRKNVVRLYAFLRVADNLVDSIPADREGFFRFLEAYRLSARGRPCGNVIIDDFVTLSDEQRFLPEWTDAFLRSMTMDLETTEYDTIDQTLSYMYGASEVIGLYMNRILGVSDSASYAARMQGRAMQIVNFVRDIDEDNQLGRRYLPKSESELPDLTEETAMNNTSAFADYLQIQAGRYRVWQREAETGYKFIPYRYLVPIKTASDMYAWTMKRIMNDPLIVFRKKVKPRKIRIVTRVFHNWLLGHRLGYIPANPDSRGTM